MHAAKFFRERCNAWRNQKIDSRPGVFADELRECWERKDEISDQAAIDDKHRPRRSDTSEFRILKPQQRRHFLCNRSIPKVKAVSERLGIALLRHC